MSWLCAGEVTEFSVNWQKATPMFEVDRFKQRAPKALAMFLAASWSVCSSSHVPDPKLPGILQRQPLIAYTSKQGPASLAECFALELSGVGIPSVVPGERRTIVSAWVIPRGDPWVTVVATLSPVPTGTAVEIRTRTKTVVGDQYADTAANAAAKCR